MTFSLMYCDILFRLFSLRAEWFDVIDNFDINFPPSEHALGNVSFSVASISYDIINSKIISNHVYRLINKNSLP